MLGWARWGSLIPLWEPQGDGGRGLREGGRRWWRNQRGVQVGGVGLRPRRDEGLGRTLAGDLLASCAHGSKRSHVSVNPLGGTRGGEQSAVMAADSIKSHSHYCTINY